MYLKRPTQLEDVEQIFRIHGFKAEFVQSFQRINVDEKDNNLAVTEEVGLRKKLLEKIFCRQRFLYLGLPTPTLAAFESEILECVLVAPQRSL